VAGDWNLVDLEGRPVSLASFRGKPVFLNIWATWCPPCVAEMPSIEALAGKAQLAGVQFACVSVEGTEETERVRKFAAERKMSVPIYVTDAPPPPAFRSEGIPATYILNADGEVVASQIGASKWDDPRVVELLETLARKAASPAEPAAEGAPTAEADIEQDTPPR
jgi:thiol-disulfide isomerase/thioredoxin